MGVYRVRSATRPSGITTDILVFFSVSGDRHLGDVHLKIVRVIVSGIEQMRLVARGRMKYQAKATPPAAQWFYLSV
jgi:hypothetical protein